MLLLFLLHCQYIELRTEGCSLPCIINTGCHLTIARVCICVIAESIQQLHYNFPVDFIKYGVTAQSFHFICWGFAVDVFAFQERIFFAVRDCHAVRHIAFLTPGQRLPLASPSHCYNQTYSHTFSKASY